MNNALHAYTTGTATRSDQYSRPQEQTAATSYTGVLEPDDLRIRLPKRIMALAAYGASQDTIVQAIQFCKFLPIVKVPDSVYVDEGDIVLYWETGAKSNVIVSIDEKHAHFYVRPEQGKDVSQSDLVIDGKVGFTIKPYLPPHPSSTKRDVSDRKDR